MALSLKGAIQCRGPERDVRRFLEIRDPEKRLNHRVYRWDAAPLIDDGSVTEASVEFEFRAGLPREIFALLKGFGSCVWTIDFKCEGTVGDWFDRGRLEKLLGSEAERLSGREAVAGHYGIDNDGAIREDIRFGEKLNLHLRRLLGPSDEPVFQATMD